MPFKQDYTKAERRANQKEPVKFATCTVTIFVRKESSMLGFRVRCCGKNSPFKSLGIKLKHSEFNSKTLQITGDPYNTARLIDLKASILKVFTERELTGRSYFSSGYRFRLTGA